MSQVTGKKVATTPMPTPTGISGNVIDSFNTQDDQTVNAPSIHIVKDALTTINDNLAQTPITVGGETLSTIDDKLNYLIEGNDLDLSIYRSKSGSMTITDLNIGKQYLIAFASIYKNLNTYLIQSNISGGTLKSKMVSGLTAQRSGESAECAVAVIEATATSITFSWCAEQGLGIAWIQLN